MKNEEFNSFGALVEARRSMREFTTEPVSETVLREVFTEAGYAPSNCNSQPWKAVVVTGEKAERMKQTLLNTIGEGKFQLDFHFDDKAYPPMYKERQQGVAKLYYGAACIARENIEERGEFIKRNLTFYGAPQAVFLFMPDWGQQREAADMGRFAQNVMLAMRARNIGSCPQTILGFNADAVREYLGIGPEWKLLFGISFGYFDKDNPLNQVRTERASIDEWLTII